MEAGPGDSGIGASRSSDCCGETGAASAGETAAYDSGSGGARSVSRRSDPIVVAADGGGTMMRRWMLMLALCASMPLCAQDDAAWRKLDFLIGKWIGVAGPKDTPLGAGQGAFSF